MAGTLPISGPPAGGLSPKVPSAFLFLNRETWAFLGPLSCPTCTCPDCLSSSTRGGLALAYGMIPPPVSRAP